MKLHKNLFVTFSMMLVVLLAACTSVATPTGGTSAPTAVGGVTTEPTSVESPTVASTAASTSASTLSATEANTPAPTTQSTLSSTSASTLAPTSSASTAVVTTAPTLPVPVTGSTGTPEASATSMATETAQATSIATSAATVETTSQATVAGSTGTPGTGSAAACTNDYFPVKSGATWNYSSSGGVLGNNLTYTRTLTDLAQNSFNTQDHFSVGGVTLTVKWNCDNGNLTPLSTGLGNGTIRAGSLTLNIASASATGYMLPGTFNSGATWTESLTLNGSVQQNGSSLGSGTDLSQIACTANGAESVTVPAGTFDAQKVTCQISASLSGNVAGFGSSSQPVQLSDTIVEWYAKGVGLIKSQNSGSSGNETVLLTQYTIP
jgi:hypothetical protein